MIAKERLFLNSDRSRVVKDGDPAASFLLVAMGSEIPPEHLQKVLQSEQVESSPVIVQTKESSIPTRRRR